MERCFEGVVVVQCKTLIIYSVLCEIASEIATLRMLHMPCTQGQICPKSPTFGGGVQVLHRDMEKIMEDLGCLQLPSHLACTGAVVHLCTAAQGFSPIFEAAPLWCGDHRLVVGFDPGHITRPIPLSRDSTV